VNFNSTLSELEAERALIDQAIQALKPLATQPETPRLVERRQTASPTPAATSNDAAPRRRRKMSAETKRKISEALKRRHQTGQSAAA
jgi:hypothetical protein